MKLFADLPILWHMVFPSSRGSSHQERLEAFYEKQAERYDDFRKRLLHGREELLSGLEFPAGGVWLDMGAGTGSTAALVGERLGRLRRAILVDLCPSLQKMARRRLEDQRWNQVELVLGDATQFKSDEPADLVTFSYSLTMIPDWFKALERAWENLKPGGQIGVVDFYVSRKWPEAGFRRHSRFQRFLWPHSYGWDNVFLSADHLPYLRHRFAPEKIEERLGRVPYMMGLKSPYYLFVGRKPGALSAPASSPVLKDTC
jgi:S-adenosylmethionine-diacylgycerolhomoserine-N-methlytransferase